jgi:nitrite reductase/ring-hydroxylating ferredoxin subunit
MSGWTSAFPLDKLPVGGAKLYQQGRDQVAVFRPSEGDLYAVDNRCPHEGYPLVQGDLKGCTLTCCWHNYKFDLRDGACLKGDEAVRTFPVRVVDSGGGSVVELDMTPPDTSAAVPGYWASMDEALREYRVGQAVRDAVRLIEAGVSGAQLAAALAAWDGARSEWGSSHCLPVAYDLLQWQHRYPGPRFAIPLAQLIDLTCRGTVRRPERTLADPIDPGSDPVAAGAALRDAVEAEDSARAEGLLRGALDKGWGRAELEPWFYRLCADHFLSFGHRLIYQTKVFDLLDAGGEATRAYAEPILCGHLFGIANGTREDVLPAWAGFRKRLAAVDLPALYAAAGRAPSWSARGPEGGALLAAVLDGKPSEAFEALSAALSAGAPLAAVVDVLSLGGAERMLRFDVAIDSDPSNQDSWLSVTHIQTFCAALRVAVARFEDPEVLRLLFYGARFINHHKVLDLPEERRHPVIPAARPDLEATLAAIVAGRTEDALGLAAGVLKDAALCVALKHALMDVAISDRFAAPIVSAHAIKNLMVACEEFNHTGDPRLVLAAVRLLSSPLQQRWTHRGALEAVAFVTEGRIPKLLAP